MKDIALDYHGLAMAVVQTNGLALEHITDQTLEICQAAIYSDSKAFQYVDESLRQAVIDQHDGMITTSTGQDGKETVHLAPSMAKLKEDHEEGWCTEFCAHCTTEMEECITENEAAPAM